MVLMPHKDPEKRRAYKRLQHAKHREARNAKCREYHAKHREATNQKRADRYRADHQRSLDYHKVYRDEHAKERAAAVKKWAKKNRDRVDKYQADYRETNRELLRIKQRSYNRLHPERVSARNARMGARRRMRIEATIENEAAIAQFIQLIRSSRRVACYYCGKMITGKSAHIDHVAPLAKGGGHTPDNLCAACPACNLTKHAKLLSEWKRSGQQILPL